MSISFDRASHFYDATRTIPAEALEQIVDSIVQVTKATPDTQFLEPGIGTGRIALPFLQRGYRYTGVDISENMMTELRRKIEASDYRLTLIQGDVTALPLPDRSFDVAIAVHLLHLVSDWQAALAEIRRVLKPDGMFIYTHGRTRPADPQEAGVNPGWYAFEQQWRSILRDCNFQVQYGANEIDVVNVLEQQGATIERITPAQWQVKQTVKNLLESYQNRIYSPCWQVPDDVFENAIDRLTNWCYQHFESIDLDVSYQAEFRFVAVRGWGNRE